PGDTYRGTTHNVDMGEYSDDAVEFWHTHPNDPAGSPGYNDVFWSGDAQAAQSRGMPGYVATESGDIRYFDPAGGVKPVTTQYGQADYGTVIPEKAPR